MLWRRRVETPLGEFERSRSLLLIELNHLGLTVTNRKSGFVPNRWQHRRNAGSKVEERSVLA